MSKLMDFAIAVFFLLAGCSPVGSVTNQPPRKEAPVINSAAAILISQSRTVTIQLTRDGRLYGLGTGVILRYRQVLTCFHELHPGLEVSVNGQPAKVLFSFPKQDLAILETDTPNFEPLTFADVQMGQVVFYVGNPHGHMGIRVMGIVEDQNDEQLFLDMRVLPGASGSGLWDREGNLVGIVHEVELVNAGNGTLIPGFGIAIPASVVKTTLGIK